MQGMYRYLLRLEIETTSREKKFSITKKISEDSTRKRLHNFLAARLEAGRVDFQMEVEEVQ